MRSIRNYFALMFAVIAWLVPLTVKAADKPVPPNVVLIISDDHCWTDYGFMGHPQIQTPHLDRLAQQSLTFRRGYVPSSLCCPSLATIITGLYPHQHKVTSNDPPIPVGMKPGEFQKSPAFTAGREVMNRHIEAVPTLPRTLAEHGYLGLQTGKWWQGHFKRGGFTHGMTKGLRHGDEGLEIGRKTMQPIYDFISTAKQEQRPFFVWYAPLLPHDPHTPPQRLLDKYKDKTPSLHVAKYWAMVEWFDETCGQLLNHLDEQRLSDNTIVIYVTDNGWIQNPDKPSFAAKSKRSPYDGGLRTPIMIRWPGKVAPQMSDELAMSIDIMPTLLNALRVQTPASLPGLNLLDPTARSRRKTIQGACFTHNAVDLNDPTKSVENRWIIDGQWKLIVPGSEATQPKQPELFDLLADPLEERNQIASEADRAKSLRQKLDAWWTPSAAR